MEGIGISQKLCISDLVVKAKMCLFTKHLWNCSNVRLYQKGVINAKFQSNFPLPLKSCISDPMFVKPKCVWEGQFFSIFENLCTFFSFLFTIFSCLFTIFKSNVRLSNAFWLYKHGVKNAYFQSYELSKSEKCKWNTLYFRAPIYICMSSFVFEWQYINYMYHENHKASSF